MWSLGVSVKFYIIKYGVEVAILPSLWVGATGACFRTQYILWKPFGLGIVPRFWKYLTYYGVFITQIYNRVFEFKEIC